MVKKDFSISPFVEQMNISQPLLPLKTIAFNMQSSKWHPLSGYRDQWSMHTNVVDIKAIFRLSPYRNTQYVRRSHYTPQNCHILGDKLPQSVIKHTPDSNYKLFWSNQAQYTRGMLYMWHKNRYVHKEFVSCKYLLKV